MGGEFTYQPKWDPLGVDPRPNGNPTTQPTLKKKKKKKNIKPTKKNTLKELRDRRNGSQVDRHGAEEPHQDKQGESGQAAVGQYFEEVRPWAERVSTERLVLTRCRTQLSHAMAPVVTCFGLTILKKPSHASQRQVPRQFA